MSVFVRSNEYGYQLISGEQGTGVSSYALVDVDGDGDLDIVAGLGGAVDAAHRVHILLNNGAGAFSDATNAIFPSGVPGTVFARNNIVADFNGDGRLDVFFGDHGIDGEPFPGGQNVLLLSSGTTGFIDATDRLPAVRDYTHSSTAGDIDGDGDIDIVVQNLNAGGALPYVLLNDGAAHFTQRFDLLPATDGPIGPGPWFTSCLLFDADGDGDLDLFRGEAFGQTPSMILINDGSGDFSNAAQRLLPGPAGPYSNHAAVDATAVDVNGDGALDLLIDNEVNDYTGGNLQILINDGSGNFLDESSARLPTSGVDYSHWNVNVYSVDINGDGFVDIVNRGGISPPIMLNDGTGHFVSLPASAVEIGPGQGSLRDASLFPSDLNGDGRMDLVAWIGFNGVDTERFVVYMNTDQGLAQTGGSDADGLLGDSDPETLNGGGGNDVIFGAAGDDTLIGGAGGDYLNGGAGVDAISGGDDSDTLSGGAGADSLNGGAGDDTLIGGAGDDALDGGDGQRDAVDYSNETLGITVNIVTFTGSATGASIGADTLTNIEDIIGGAGNDLITGSFSGNLIWGGAGDDVITAIAGGDTIDGGAGYDVLVLSGNRADYSITLVGATIIGTDGPSGADSISNIEAIQFDDGLYTPAASFWQGGIAVYDRIAGQDPASIVPLDVDGDGDIDLIVPFSVQSPHAQPVQSIHILANDGTGNFTDVTAQFFPNGGPIVSDLWKYIVADFNGDGRPDVYFIDEGNDDFFSPNAGWPSTLLLSSGAHGFVDASANIGTNQQTDHYGGAAADIDGDGDVDILDVDLNQGTLVGLQIRINDGTGHFTADNSRLPADTLDVAHGVYYMCATFFDADNDGDKDLVLGAWDVANNGQPSLLLFNDGAGHFSENAKSFAIQPIPNFGGSGHGSTIEDIQAVDVNGDGAIDVVTSDNISENGVTLSTMRIFLNDGHGNLTDASSQLFLDSPLNSGFILSRIRAVDINSDGSPDLLGYVQNHRVFFINDGTGHFKATTADFLADTDFGPGDDPSLRFAVPSVGDINGDGRVDFIGGNGHLVGTSQDYLAILYGQDQPLSQTGDGNANTLLGDGDAETLSGLGGDDVIFAAAGNDTLIGGAGGDYLNGGAGVDTVSYASSTSGVSVDLLAGAASGGDGQGDTLVFVENVIGSALADLIVGDAGGNVLSGLGGDDSINGGAGADTMAGGAGNDTYFVDSLGDVITENAGQGIDAALVSVSGYTLSANIEVAAIQGGGGLALTGNALGNILYGAAGSDTLNGGDGDDTLQGGASADTMNGGLGNDTFYVAQAGDVVIENSGEGFDATIVQMTGAYTLAANVEVGATFLGSGVNITGNALDNLLYGNGGNDTLNGASGNDTIQGNAGNDAMAGGLGNDTYFFEDAGDVITENIGEGTDAVIVFTSSYTLAANVEVGARFLTTAYTLTGNSLDNQLYGNNGADTLNGGDGNDTIQGGGGNDIMAGGLGNDTYLVEQVGDVVTENSGEGSDAVIVLIGSYTLAANVEVGATFLTSGVSIAGNNLDNRLYGNSGADTLNGGAGADLLEGGAGADALTGGSENDTFMFVAGQANGDVISDFAGNGAAAGDVLRFSGYGGGGATFVQLDATHWQINSADGTIHDTITLANGASVDASDWLFV